jgi:SAM-dependent methyltransferase
VTDVTADGCPVEVYTLLPAAGEPEIVDSALPSGVDVLDLGCGTGRIAHPLAELGYRVFGVDDSPEMLEHLRGVESRCARIEDVRLDRRFGGVLLASHLFNVPSAATRRALLSTGLYHLADDGRLLIEWHPETWFDTVADGQGGTLGQLEVRIENVSRDGDLLSATVRYALADRSWTQPFTARRLTETDMHAELSAAGLVFDGWCTPDRTWFAARRRR